MTSIIVFVAYTILGLWLVCSFLNLWFVWDSNFQMIHGNNPEDSYTTLPSSSVRILIKTVFFLSGPIGTFGLLLPLILHSPMLQEDQMMESVVYAWGIFTLVCAIWLGLGLIPAIFVGVSYGPVLFFVTLVQGPLWLVILSGNLISHWIDSLRRPKEAKKNV